ncbi:response regulator [Acidobacteriota bacterium]
MKDQTIKVLIVDDEERFRATTSNILNSRGFLALAVGSGNEAIDVLSQEEFDVVILDVKMPGMSGNEALREIKRLQPNVQVIMLTGHGTPESALDGLRNGVFDYLRKPCHVEVIARKIRDAVSRRNGVSEAELKVRNIMIPLSNYSTIREERSVLEAIEIFTESFKRTRSTSTLQEGVHRSILVLGKGDEVNGVLSFTDLLKGLQPPYIGFLRDQPTLADSIYEYAPGFSGMFTIMARDLARKKVHEIMSGIPHTIDAGANLMEAVNRILSLDTRRLLVLDGGVLVGIVREQDLVFQLARIIRS